MLFLVIFLVFILSYLIGSIPFGFILGKLNGIDIREHGSRNIGATNVLRTLGKKWGYLCFVLDFLKGFFPVAAVFFFNDRFFSDIGSDTAIICAFAGVFCGHVWTIFLGFKGGKGVATSAGALFALSPFSLLACLFIWILVFRVWRYVSLASIVAALALPFFTVLSNMFLKKEFSLTMLVFFCAISVVTVAKHFGNIKRLITGKELKFGEK
jgi:glycerol-3-phosphate acyltransferase PlsY